MNEQRIGWIKLKGFLQVQVLGTKDFPQQYHSHGMIRWSIPGFLYTILHQAFNSYPVGILEPVPVEVQYQSFFCD
jgi:hypothetical protein